MEAYDLDFEEEGKLKLHIQKFLLYPQYWQNESNAFSGNVNWESCLFTPENRDRVPRLKGIYCFVVIPKYDKIFETRYLFYVGKTSRTLWERYKEYLDDLAGKGKPRKKVFKMLKLYNGYLHFFYTPLDSKLEVDTFEDRLLNIFVPHVNTQIPDARIKDELKYIYE